MIGFLIELPSSLVDSHLLTVSSWPFLGEAKEREETSLFLFL